MIEVWGVPLLAEVIDILEDLRFELASNHIPLLKDLKHTHNNVLVTCISHGDGQERKPSCGISLVDTKRPDGRIDPAGTVHCFTCGYKADLAEFVSNCFGHNDRGMFGYRWIAQRYVNVSVELRKDIVLDMSRETIKVGDVNYISEEELASYRFTHPYMYERKLTDKVIEYFDVGYDQDKDALTFPVTDKKGNVLFVQRRAVVGKAFLNEADVPKGSTVYGIYQVWQNISWIKELIVCESIIDALYCWTVRKPAVAIMGASPTSLQVRLLKELPIRKYIEAMDNDEAGRRAAEKLKKGLGSSKLLYRAVIPDYAKDLNDMTEEDIKLLQSTILLH